jgi:alkane 1-monooxygenase
MLSGMSYRHFRIAHVFGHHRSAATGDDPATARLGEGVYRFLARSIAGQYRDSWRIERARLEVTGRSPYRHRLLADAVIMACIYLAILALAGWKGVLLFALQGAVAILILEVFNYIAHYGLLRRDEGEGLEPFGANHSWNSSNTFANAFIFNMGRHAQHHASATAPYQSLEHDDSVQELPFGYAASILLALIPPLWHQIMDPAVQRLQNRPSSMSP